MALVGPSGVGKTTLCSLIPRFYDVSSGAITIDGVDIRDIKLNDLRNNVGIVQQDVYLFAGTILDNIRYGRMDATDEEVVRAAKNANAHEFIMRLPEGYQTGLKGSGSSLSQGQRQLLAIARVAVADPPVLILDEATSSIDTKTELLVQDGIEALLKGRTSFVIAHRLSTIQHADKIIVMHKGRIRESGTHQELLDQDGIYRKLYQLQLA